MDITQTDRDKLREKQQSLNSKFIIGNLVEHKTQDPRKYKEASRHQESSSSTTNGDEQFKVTYQSKYFTSCSPITTIREDQELEIPISTEDIQANMWLNMNQVEFDKLEWMSSKAEKSYREHIKGSTRFDKDGRVVQPKPGKNGDQSAEADGHDLDSLVKLLDSTYQPQVIYALNVITKIASYATMGYYDGTFDENIHELLLKNCLLRVRHHLDSTNETTCQSAIKCLRALLCNSQVDEVILDRIFPIIIDSSDPNLWLQTMEIASKEFTIGMKDIECVEIDAIKALVERTDILTRFNHLLNNKSAVSYYECILDILIRIARHSPNLACVINRKELMSTITELFLRPSITTQNEPIRPLSTKALKLIRIITEGLISLERQHQRFPLHLGASKKLPSTILAVLNSYLAIDGLDSITSNSDDLFKLHLETIRCLKTFSLFKQFKEDIIDMVATNRDKIYISFQAFTKLESTKSLGTKISFDWQYAAHLIDLIGLRNQDQHTHVGEQMKTSIWNLFAQPILYRWLNDITRDKIVPHLDVSITIVATLKHFKTRSEQFNGMELREQIFKPILKNREENGTRSPNIFKILSQKAGERSQLPSQLNTNGRLRDPKNLPSYGWLQFNSASEHCFKLDPLFDTDSPFFLLDVYLTQLDKWNTDEPEALNIFLEVHILRYLRSISGYQKQPMKYETLVQQSFAAQFEIQIIAKTILLMSKCYINLAEPKRFADLDTRLEDEKYEFRKDDYGNLCYYAISVMGLLFDNETQNLKADLIKKLLLNETLQEKISIEYLSKPTGQRLVSTQDGERIIDPCHISMKQLHFIALIYESCMPYDRFWIFQPVLLYYLHIIKDTDENHADKMQNDRWLVENMPWSCQRAELQSLNDASLMSAILNFNYRLMTISSAYKQLLIRPKVEDYICMIGVLFLHDDIFLDEDLSEAISHNLEFILTDCPGENKEWKKSLFKDASKSIETFDLPLADFFNRLVDQYESVSYGDVAFANLLLLFLSPYSDKVFKRKFFQEKLDTCVKQIRIAPSEVWALDKIYLTQKEPDREIIQLYQRAKRYTKQGTFLNLYLEYHTS